MYEEACTLSYTHTQLTNTISLSSLISSPFVQDDHGSTGYTVLMMASYTGFTAAVEAIVAADPHPDHIRMKSKYGGQTALMVATQGQSIPVFPRIVEILIKADPSADHLDMKVRSPLT